MERVNAILKNSEYREYLQKNRQWEKGRKFCKHNMGHFLDVARIAHLYNLDENLGFEKELLYAAALLHDIGKWQQYECGIPHNESSAILSGPILKECGFSDRETELILKAIADHRRDTADKRSFSHLLYRADKKSRRCFDCKMNDKCKWADETKNITIEI